MKPLQRIICIKAIQGSFKDRSFTWEDIYSYLHAYDKSVSYYSNDNWDSTDEYVSFQCGRFPDETIALMYEELVGKEIVDVDIDTGNSSLWRSGYYRLFISHLTKDKVPVSFLKRCLSNYGIDCFVAHEDIEPSKEWIKEIKRALRSADALCAVFSEGFNESKWCDQEVGIALGRRIPIISIKKGADPHGFLSEFQAIPAKRKANEVAEDCFTTLCAMDGANGHYYSVLTKLLLDAGNVEECSKWLDGESAVN
ncbi:MAG: toll/interleukin-1 receptor domain-containing protein [Bacteroidales bacterium]|nr:toll/interleukin-1 receptor domain-containing protein [Bacteroidales bacterium]